VLRYPVGEAGCELRGVYNACIVGTRRFRDTHIQIVSRYILLPAPTVKKQCPRAATGTGTELVSFLKQVRQETIAATTFKPLPKMTPAPQAQPDWKMGVLMGKSRGLSFC
jgi:hypothetical protein